LPAEEEEEEEEEGPVSAKKTAMRARYLLGARPASTV